jgi:hypothetical protein
MQCDAMRCLALYLEAQVEAWEWAGGQTMDGMNWVGWENVLCSLCDVM